MTRRPSAAAPATRRCAIYTRKSTTHGLEQDFNSLDAQYESCFAYVQAQPGWSVLPERYDDGGWSGGNIERPAFQRLLRDIDAGRVDIVVVYKLDRLSRSLRDFALLMDRFQTAGVAFASITQQFDTSTSMGKLTLHLLMSFAEFERSLISERTRDKIAGARRRGKWTGGPVPFGYEVRDKMLIPCEHESIIVQEMFTLFLRHQEVAAVARELNERGLVPRDGRRRIKSEAPRWNKTSVTRVLMNPIYTGLIPSGDELYQAEHDAIIKRELWDQARALMEGCARDTRYHGRNPEYLLRGVLRCTLCGGAFTPASTRGKGGREYRYYRCTTRDKHGSKVCVAKPLPAGAIEGFIVQRIREATADGALSHDIAHRLEVRAARQRAILLAERRALPAQIARLSSDGANLASSLATVTGTAKRLLEAKIEGVGAELGRYEVRLAEVEKAITALESAERDAKWVADAMRDFDAVWPFMTADNQGRLIRALVHEVVVDEPAGEVSATLIDLSVDRIADTAPGAETPIMET